MDPSGPRLTRRVAFWSRIVSDSEKIRDQKRATGLGPRLELPLGVRIALVTLPLSVLGGFYALPFLPRAAAVVAEIVDPFADDPLKARTPVTTQTEGTFLSRRAHKMVRPGDSIAKIVGKEPLAYRTGMLLVD